MEQADHIALKVNRLIAHNRSIALAGASNTDTRQLWSLLKRIGNWGANKQTISNIDLNQINDYFANIAIDPVCDRGKVIKAALRAHHRVVNFVNYSRDSIELILARTKKTSPGSDNVPYWVYRNCVHELSEVFTMIVNMSVAFGVVPSAGAARL